MGTMAGWASEAAAAAEWAAFERACARTRRLGRRALARGVALGPDERFRVRAEYHTQERAPAADPMEALRRAASAVRRACALDPVALEAWHVYLAARATWQREDAALDLRWLARTRPALHRAWGVYQVARSVAEARPAQAVRRAA